MVIYHYTHGITATIMTVRKYMHLVLDALISHNKLLWKYISVLSSTMFNRIIVSYIQSCPLPNVCNNIVGCHMLLSKKRNKKQATVVADFWCKERASIQLFYKVVVTWIRCFGMSNVPYLVELVMVDNSSYHQFIDKSKEERFSLYKLSSSMVIISNLSCWVTHHTLVELTC